jgi:hypothetical protein
MATIFIRLSLDGNGVGPAHRVGKDAWLRSLLDRRSMRCDPECRGYFVSGDRGTLERCDDCCAAIRSDGGPFLGDEDFLLLDEALLELATEAVAAAPITTPGLTASALVEAVSGAIVRTAARPIDDERFAVECARVDCDYATSWVRDEGHGDEADPPRFCRGCGEPFVEDIEVLAAEAIAAVNKRLGRVMERRRAEARADDGLLRALALYRVVPCNHETASGFGQKNLPTWFQVTYVDDVIAYVDDEAVANALRLTLVNMRLHGPDVHDYRPGGERSGT